MLDQDLRRQTDRFIGRDAAVGDYLQDQTVVVRLLADTRILDLVVDPPDRSKDRVDGNHADRLIRRLVPLGRHIAPSPLEGELHLQLGALLQGGNMKIGVEDLGVRGTSMSAAGTVPRVERRPTTTSSVCILTKLLQVEHDVGGILSARNRRNSWSTPSIRIEVTAAPGKDDSKSASSSPM